MVKLDPGAATPLMHAALISRGATTSAAHHVVGSLLQTSLRGVDSHGARLFPHYVRALEAGRINQRPTFHLDAHGTTTATLDADSGFGHEAGSIAMQSACDMASAHGSGIVAVRNSSHLGAAAYFGLQAAERDMIGFAFTNADALVKAPGSAAAFFGTNPVCFCAPMANEGPFCLDMATSTVSWNKLMRWNEGEIPLDWAFTADGSTARSPSEAASLAPSGGYKGFGLGMMVSILCCLLADGDMDPDIPPMFRSDLSRPRGITHCFMALRIDGFVKAPRFKERLAHMAARIRTLPTLGHEYPMVPGDPEKRAFLSRSLSGIPLPEDVFQEYVGIDSKFAAATHAS